MSGKLVWVAWRNSQRNFGPYHRVYQAPYTVCGKIPEGITDTRKTPPKPQQECGTCRMRDQLRVRRVNAVPKMW